MEKKKTNNVKFNKDKQQKMKFLSKFIYILAKIGKVITIIAGVCLLLAMAITPVLVGNISIKDNSITIFGEKVEYENYQDEIVISVKGIKVGSITGDDIAKFNLATSELEKINIPKLFSYVEFALVTSVAITALTYFILLYLEKLFVNIYNKETPFIIDNINYIKKIAHLLIAIVATSFVCDLISSAIFDFTISTKIDLTSLIYVLIIFSISYIFEYGYELQKNSKATMYSEVEE